MTGRIVAPSSFEAWSRASKAAVVVGAIGSAGLTLWAGRHNPSLLLHVLFAGWVLLPCAGLLAAHRAAQNSPPGVGAAMHAAIVALAVLPVALYVTVAVLAPGHPATFAFLAVPAVSWLALG